MGGGHMDIEELQKEKETEIGNGTEMIVNLLDIDLYMSPKLCRLIAICTKTQLVMGEPKT